MSIFFIVRSAFRTEDQLLRLDQQQPEGTDYSVLLSVQPEQWKRQRPLPQDANCDLVYGVHKEKIVQALHFVTVCDKMNKKKNSSVGCFLLSCALFFYFLTEKKGRAFVF